MEAEDKALHIRCIVKRNIYYNSDSGYSVFSAIPEGDKKEIIVTGSSFAVSEGALLDIKGTWQRHEKYGLNFVGESWMEVRPETEEGIIKYLASGKIKGIGKKFAKAIVDRFGLNTFEIIENYPSLLQEIPYLGSERAQRASEFIKQQSLERDVMVFLSSYGISYVFVKKIIKTFGHGAVQAVKDDPYCLIEKIDGISFKSADRIAKAMGYSNDDPRRLQAGVLFVMSELVRQGDCYILYEQLLKSAGEILSADAKKIEYAVQSNFRTGHLVNNNEKIYLSEYYNAECYCAERIVGMLQVPDYWDNDNNFNCAEYAIREIQHEENMEYDDIQKVAIRQALRNRVMILTGGPGTGKTTVLKGILCALRMKQYSIAVCAPTGRAAKRAKESTGYDVSTIHRMLSFSWEVNGFMYNEANLLEEDVIVIDEFSMVDLLLFQSLLKAMSLYKRLIIVGDVDQLPSVGAGNVLKDLIDSNAVPVVRLETIHRQKENNRIPFVAYDIKMCRMPVLDNRGSKDFFFINNKDEKLVAEEIVSLVADRLPKAYGIHSSDIQVLCPKRSNGLTCSSALNKNLQARLNPSGLALQYGETFFREGDVVMQMKNNYDKGVFNGDIGIISEVNEEMGFLKVSYQDSGLTVTYKENDLDELDLSYATTIHKSQGSEYNTVIIPILNSAYIMLQCNLIYTAATRAKERCIIIGDRQALYAAVTNLYLKNRRLFVNRQTYLCQRIQNLISSVR